MPGVDDWPVQLCLRSHRGKRYCRGGAAAEECITHHTSTKGPLLNSKIPSMPLKAAVLLHSTHAMMNLKTSLAGDCMVGDTSLCHPTVWTIVPGTGLHPPRREPETQ